jgi:hypothetical protein
VIPNVQRESLPCAPAHERLVASPQSLITIEREFSTGDPSLVRAAVFELLHRGRIQALELHTESLSFLTRFVAIQAPL